MNSQTISITTKFSSDLSKQFSEIFNTNALTWNVMPLLHEVKHALQRLINQGESSIIDLRSIPLAPGEESKILDTLGKGEIQSQMNALGQSEIIETQYAGVWVVTHYNDEAEIMSRFIEITRIPEILCSQKEDMLAAYEKLVENLQEKPVENDYEEEKPK